MKIWKKNMIAAAVLVTVCGGIYVNWLYTDKEASTDLVDTLNADKILSTDMLVMADGSVLKDNAQTSMIDYFAAVRLSRQEARDSAVSLLQEAMAYHTDTSEVQTNAQLEDIVQTALCEAQIESLVIAKGYADCVAYMHSGIVLFLVLAFDQLLKFSIQVRLCFAGCCLHLGGRCILLDAILHVGKRIVFCALGLRQGGCLGYALALCCATVTGTCTFCKYLETKHRDKRSKFHRG